MTHDEFKDKFIVQNIVIDSKNIGHLIGVKVDKDGIIDYVSILEAKIAELENPKSCTNCKYFNPEVGTCVKTFIKATPYSVGFSGCGLHEIKDETI